MFKLIINPKKHTEKEIIAILAINTIFLNLLLFSFFSIFVNKLGSFI